MPSIYTWDRVLETPKDYDFNSTVIRAHEKVVWFTIHNHRFDLWFWWLSCFSSSTTQPNLLFIHGQQMTARCSLPLGSQDTTPPRTSPGTIIPSWPSGLTPPKVCPLVLSSQFSGGLLTHARVCSISFPSSFHGIRNSLLSAGCQPRWKQHG